MKISKPDPSFKHFKRGVQYWMNDHGGWLDLGWVQEGINFKKISKDQLEKYLGVGDDGTDGNVLYGLRVVWYQYNELDQLPKIDRDFTTLYKLMNDEFNDNSIGPYG